MNERLRPLIVIFGIDAVREKNMHQIRLLARHGYTTHVFSTQPRHGPSEPFAVFETLEPTTAGRLCQIMRFLRRHRRAAHHVEVIPSGRFAWIYALVTRALRVKLLAVDVGVLTLCERRAYPLTTRMSMYLAFRLADRIWYKQPNAARLLDRWRLRSTFFLPNGVPLPPPSQTDDRSIDFLWVNRLIPERYPERFAEAVRDLSQTGPVTCDVLGFSGPGTTVEQAHLEQRVRSILAGVPSCRCYEYTDPVTFYERARFFVLPSDYEAGNFALLEAMSHGVVPILTRGNGSELIIESGRNGILADTGVDALASVMRAALSLEIEEWRSMSNAARRTIEDRFSLERWGKRLLSEYATLSATGRVG